MSTDYAVTIKCIKKGVFASTEEIYEVYLKMLEKCYGISCGYDFEKDALDRWHLHAYFKARDNLFKRGLQRPFWHIYIEKLHSVDDVERWARYIHKNDNFVKERIESEYSFIN